MRWLASLVGIETIILLVLLSLWLSRDPAPPPPSPAAGQSVDEAIPLAQMGSAQAAGAAAGSVAMPQRSAAISAPGRSSIILRGRLLTDSPLGDVSQVRASCSRAGVWRSAELHTNGCYAIADLAPGTWRLRCEAPGYRRIDIEHTLSDAPFQQLDIALAAAPVLPVFLRTSEDLRLQSELAKVASSSIFSISLVATREPLSGDFEPVESAILQLTGVGSYRQDPGQQRSWTEDAADGVLELDEDPPVYAAVLLRNVVLAQQRIEVGQTELRFTMEVADVLARLAKVRCRLIGPAGPLEGVSVRLSTAQGGGTHSKSDQQGNVYLENALPGIAAVVVDAPGLERYQTHWTLKPAVEHDLGDIVLAAPVQRRGKVVDAAGRPVRATLRQTALDLWRPPHPSIDRSSQSSDAEGNFIQRMGPRRYSVIAYTDDRRVGFAIVDGASANPEDLTITVLPTQEVRLRNQATKVRVAVIEDLHGNMLMTKRLELRWPESVLHLPDGDYQLRVYDGHGQPLGREALRLAGAAVSKELR